MTGTRATEREITTPVDLCLPTGQLNPEAIGWTRHPLHRSNLRGWGRAKRWEYWGIVSPTHIIGLVASSLDYAGVHGIYVLDRKTSRELTRDAITPLARSTRMPDRSGIGTASAEGRGVTIDLEQHPGGTSLRATAQGIHFEAEIPLPEGHESLGVVVPWSRRRFQYTVKDLGRPVHGQLTLGTEKTEKTEETEKTEKVPIRASESFAVLDHGRGKWPYAITWNWAAGCAPGRALQLGGKWTDGTGSTENALFIDGRLHKISDELAWSYDRTDWLRPWRITGPRVQAEFHPFHEKRARTALGVLSNETHQCFGHFTGRAQTDDGDWIDLDGLTGWAEEARNRW